MPDLILSYFDSEATPLASGSIYALLFEPRAVEALDLDSGNLAEFDSQPDFAIVLYEHSVRTRYHRREIDPVDIDLPNTEQGDYYQVEYWHRAGGTPDRSTDRLLAIEYFTWLDNLRADVRLSESQITDDIFGHEVAAASATFEEILVQASKLPDEPAGVRWEAFGSISYMPNIQRTGLCGWLEKDGQRQTDATQAVFKLVDSDGTVLFEETVTDPNGPEADGEFFGQNIGVIFNPNDNYWLSVTIRDADGNDHTSASSPVTWN